LSRRRWLAILGAGLAAAGGGAVAVKSILDGSETVEGLQNIEETHLQLPGGLTVNPGFMTKSIGDGCLLVWTLNREGKYTAYRLNASGAALVGLCDGTLGTEEAARRYATQVRRDRQEALAFIQELSKLGILVSGGRVVIS
jgi:hypothetical protein